MQCGMRAVSKLMIAAGMLAGYATAQAQYAGMKPSWYLVPQVSAFDPDNRYKVDGIGAGGGLLLGAPVSNDFDVQLLLNHARRSDAGNKMEQSLAGVEALYLFNRGEFQPFLSFGVGAERDKRNLTGTQLSTTSPYASVGVGARWMMSNNLGLQLDYRRVEGFLRKSSDWGFKQSGNNYVNLGLMWTFGAEPPRPAPKLVAAPPPASVAPPPPPPAPKPKIEAAPVAPKVVAPPPVQRITLDASKLFALNSARLAPPVEELDRFAAAMQSNPDVTNVAITGHTDQLGTAAINNRLSQQRADAVKAYLVGKGVAATRLTAKGMGSTKLVKDCKEKTRAAMITCGEPNRRVEVEPITVIKK